MNIMESPATMMRRLRHAEDAYDGRWADDAEEAANAAFAAMGAEVERRDAERERERSLAEVRRRGAEHNFETLVTLRADGNAIVRLPPFLNLAPCLATLSLKSNLLEALPALPPRLETLDVADNDLARLFPECEALRTLVVAGNALTAADVAGAPFLTRLDLGSNQLAAVAGLGVLADLEVLDLENRAWLRSDPDARPAANSVASLDVVAPLLHEPWPRLRELRALDARGNRIGDAPSVLLSLDLSDNRVAALAPLPPTVAAVRLRNNRLLALPPLPASLELLVVDGNRLGAIPAAPKLRLLEATRNRLAALPELPALRVLAVAGNRLAALHLRASAQLSVVLAAENVVASVDLPATVRVLALFRNPAEAGASTAAHRGGLEDAAADIVDVCWAGGFALDAAKCVATSVVVGSDRCWPRDYPKRDVAAASARAVLRPGAAVAAANLDRAALVHERARRTDWLPLGLDLRGAGGDDDLARAVLEHEIARAVTRPATRAHRCLVTWARDSSSSARHRGVASRTELYDQAVASGADVVLGRRGDVWEAMASSDFVLSPAASLHPEGWKRSFLNFGYSAEEEGAEMEDDWARAREA
ncbi:hypothetical protein JL721_4957 [Aureococcus anophagefferens]|nr:hypothetical protein JL721_4957 [Aureococcus anophagefferens]